MEFGITDNSAVSQITCYPCDQHGGVQQREPSISSGNLHVTALTSGTVHGLFVVGLFSVFVSYRLFISQRQDYCASKFGAIGFHESLSHEIKASEKDGIKMTLVCPYLVDTGMFRGCRIR